MQCQDISSPPSRDIFPISSLTRFEREKIRTLRSYKGGRIGEYKGGSSWGAKNSSSSAQVKNILSFGDGIQMWSELQLLSLSSDTSICRESIREGMMNKQSYKTVHHGIRKQQHSSSHDEETQLAGLIHKIIRQASAFDILQNNQSGQCFLYPAALIALEHQTAFAKN